MFDVLMIGKGLMGSAAARYLQGLGAATAVLGPDEPQNPQTHDGVFASHYDQGRITRRLSKDITWATLADRSMAQYRELETRSGIQFYEPTGGLYVGPNDGSHAYWQNAATIGQRFGVAYSELTNDELAARLPKLRFPAGFAGILEHAPAGYINPRGLIQAQLAVFAAQGGTILRETAVTITYHPTHLTIQTKEGNQYETRKLLIAAGGFSNCFGLLERPLPLRLKSETIILAELDAAEAARLGDMPTVIYEIESPDISGIYLLPPIRYPDGRFYLKMGCDTRLDQTLPHDVEAIRRWFIHGNSDAILPAMRAALEDIIPELRAESWQTKRCLITYTPHGKPLIDAVVPGQVYVATGGNGSSAKSSDAIGQLAASLTWHDAWQDTELDAQLYAIP
ncbi:MAG: FAD-binding oxidoreductase [Ardenticatenaceae bacterium]|nr:FAD-binding oxidoreductase [Ardenticatenaceae bacterium]